MTETPFPLGTAVALTGRSRLWRAGPRHGQVLAVLTFDGALTKLHSIYVPLEDRRPRHRIPPAGLATGGTVAEVQEARHAILSC